MAEEQPLNGDLADSIAMLEQILEVMPQDIDALKTLYNAYIRCGEKTRAFEYLQRMVDVVAATGETSSVVFIQSELCRYEDDEPAAVAGLSARLPTVPGVNEDPVTASKGVSMEDFGISSSFAEDSDVSEELSLAWKLYEEDQLSQEEYSTVLHDLTEISSKELSVPATVLHVLHDRGFPQLNRVMNHMSSRSGAPCIPLGRFELSKETVSLLPLSMVQHAGVLPFGTMGDALLVAVLNPFNTFLVEKAERMSGRRCYTYLVSPEDYDSTLSAVSKLHQG